MSLRVELSRTQALVLGFLGLAWMSLIGILVLAPGTYDEVLQVPASVRLVSFVSLSALIVGVLVGVLKRWRWIFWLLLIANLAGALRVAVSLLELLGWLPLTGPSWYVEFQAVLGAAQFVLGLVMLADYRHEGIWGRRGPTSARVA